MGTIVQEYGPLYGEAVNGTVQGRPNGSVYVPLSNKIEISGYPDLDDITIAKDNPTYPYRINSSKSIHIVAVAQDLASNIMTAIYSDADCTTIVGTALNFAAGQFNLERRKHLGSLTGTLESGTYYFRATLINNSTAIAVSDVLEVTAE